MSVEEMTEMYAFIHTQGYQFVCVDEYFDDKLLDISDVPDHWIRQARWDRASFKDS